MYRYKRRVEAWNHEIQKTRNPSLTLVGRLSSKHRIRSVSSIPLLRDTSSRTSRSSIGITTLGSSSSGGLLGSLTLDLLRVTVEEQIRDDFPSGRSGGSSGDGASESEDFSAEEVPKETDRVL